MTKFKPQYRRLIFIDQKIRDGSYPNCATLGRAWEVSAKTVQRDITYMKWELGAPVEYDTVRHGYHYTETNYRMPAITINESDLFAICIAEKALAQYKDTPLYDRLASIFAKIEGSLPDHVSVHPSWAQSRITFFGEPAARIVPEVWDTITRAVRDSRTLRIRHHSPVASRRARDRDLDPYHLISYRGQWYLIAHCHRSDKIRTFAVSRITSARVLERGFTLPDTFDIKNLLGSHFGIMWGKEEYAVRIRFHSKAAPYIEERVWHPSQKITRNRDGSIVLSFTTNHLNEVKDWVLSWGAAAKVISPKQLVEKVATDLRTAAGLYTGKSRGRRSGVKRRAAGSR